MKELERDLGLPSVLAISVGAMIGSGIFILPALALKIAGPAVIVAYLLAGLLVIPAALSKSEMATAMPEAGGTYIYIERGMGPLLGTIAGVGTWFSLSFKGALALVGGVPYLLILFDLPLKPVALGLAAVLWFVLVVTFVDELRRQLAALGIVAGQPRPRVWSRVTPPSLRTAGYVVGLVVGGAIAAVTFELAVDAIQSLIPVVATVDPWGIDLAEVLVMVVFFVAYSTATHSLDRLIVGTVRSLSTW